MTKSIFLTSVLLIFMGLSVSADDYSAKYYFGNVYMSASLPSTTTATDAGILSDYADLSEPNITGRDLTGPMRGGFDNDDEDDLTGGGGGTIDPDCSWNDCPVGNGAYVLISLLAAYGVMLFYRRKKTVNV